MATDRAVNKKYVDTRNFAIVAVFFCATEKPTTVWLYGFFLQRSAEIYLFAKITTTTNPKADLTAFFSKS
jgi:hypothetical protein